MKPMLQCIIGSICSGVIDITISTGSAYELQEYQTNHRNSQLILVKIYLTSLRNKFMRISIKFVINSDG